MHMDAPGYVPMLVVVKTCPNVYIHSHHYRRTAQHCLPIDQARRPYPLQRLPLDAHTRALHATYLHVGAVDDSTALGEFSLVAVLPPLQPWQAAVFTLQPLEEGYAPQPPQQPPRHTTHLLPSTWWRRLQRRVAPPAPVVASNGNVTLVFSPEGVLTTLTVNGMRMALSVLVQWYTPSDGSEAEDHGQCGGAYILRVGQERGGFAGGPVLSVVEGPVVTEVHQQWAPWATLVYRCVVMLTLMVGNRCYSIECLT